MCKSGATTGKLAVVDTDVEFSVWSPLALIRANATKILSRFLFLALHATYVQDQIRTTWTHGTQPNISMGAIERLLVAAPPLRDQARLVDLLDEKLAKVDALIAKKERLIELLQEKRTALISHAVTKGLDRGVAMKDSGVDWLGLVPARWSIKPLCRVVNIVGGMTPSKDNKDFWGGEVPWVSPKDMKRPELEDSEDHITSHAVTATPIAVVQTKAVLMVVRGMILAKDLPVAVNLNAVTINQDMKALIPKDGLLAGFLAHHLRAIRDAFFAVLEESGHGTKCLRTEVWRNVRIAIPPIHEQQLICAHLGTATAKLDCLIEKVTLAMEKLREYRTALISAAVTGKIDVREEGQT